MQFCVVKVRLTNDLDPFVLVLYWRSLTEIDSCSLAYECEWNLPIVQFLKDWVGLLIDGWNMLGVETYLTCLWDLSRITPWSNALESGTIFYNVMFHIETWNVHKCCKFRVGCGHV